ncbi:aspartyl protease 37-like, partial [Aegilops tauschii subsp. strangulata]|uniref:aspartyl protease 37-like n=1 Tax=Aegilops tauschii subsp. strangulata TaxID=200361 RepID=UPI003CC85F70
SPSPAGQPGAHVRRLHLRPLRRAAGPLCRHGHLQRARLGAVWTPAQAHAATPTFLPHHFGSFAPVAPCPSWVRNNSGSFGQIHYADRTCHAGDYSCAARGRYVEHIYGAGNTSGYLATDKFRLGNTKVRSLVFGCSHKVTVPDSVDVASGFVGFNRGPVSLVSQLRISRFSYFITLPDDPDNNKAFVSLSWADHADAKGSHTPLLAARPNQNPYLYYVNLTGLQVDGQLLTDTPAGTFDVRANGSGGVFLSTTSRRPRTRF